MGPKSAKISRRFFKSKCVIALNIGRKIKYKHIKTKPPITSSTQLGRTRKETSMNTNPPERIEAKKILPAEDHWKVALNFFLTHQSPTIKLGIV